MTEVYIQVYHEGLGAVLDESVHTVLVWHVHVQQLNGLSDQLLMVHPDRNRHFK